MYKKYNEQKYNYRKCLCDKLLYISMNIDETDGKSNVTNVKYGKPVNLSDP